MELVSMECSTVVEDGRITVVIITITITLLGNNPLLGTTAYPD
jgi:hypothetical protein